MSIRAIIAYIFSFVGLILTNYGLYKLLEIGTCGVYRFSDISTQQYASSPPCPEGAGTAVGAAMIGLFLVSSGIFLVVLSFKKMNLRSIRQGILLGVVTWSLLFVTMGVTFIVAMGDSLSVGLATMFGLMGLAPLPFLPLLYRRYDVGFDEPRNFPQRSTVTSSAPASPTITAFPNTPGVQDSHVTRKIAELTELHKKGILTDLEFEQQKQKLLGRL